MDRSFLSPKLSTSSEHLPTALEKYNKRTLIE
jgi:hypothetical protein